MSLGIISGIVASGQRGNRYPLSPGVHTMKISSDIYDWDYNVPYIEGVKSRIQHIAGVPNFLEFRGTAVVSVSGEGEYTVEGGKISLVGHMPIIFKGSAESIFWFYDGESHSLNIPSWSEPDQSLPANARVIAEGVPANTGFSLNKGFFSIATGSFPEPLGVDLVDSSNSLIGLKGADLNGHQIAGIPLNNGIINSDGSVTVSLRGVPAGDLRIHPTEGCTDAVLMTEFMGLPQAFYMSGTITLSKQ